MGQGRICFITANLFSTSLSLFVKVCLHDSCEHLSVDVLRVLYAERLHSGLEM